METKTYKKPTVLIIISMILSILNIVGYFVVPFFKLNNSCVTLSKLLVNQNVVIMIFGILILIAFIWLVVDDIILLILNPIKKYAIVSKILKPIITFALLVGITLLALGLLLGYGLFFALMLLIELIVNIILVCRMKRIKNDKPIVSQEQIEKAKEEQTSC